MMQAYLAVIFDLDGTLLDTLEDLADATNRALGRMGFPGHPTEAFRYLVGDGVEMLVTRALPADRRDSETIDACIRIYKEEYDRNKYAKTWAYEGIGEMLDGVSAAGMKMAVLSNKPVNPSRAIVDALRLADFFVKVYGGNSFETKKPDPLGVNILLKETGTAPANAMIVSVARSR